MAWHCKNDNTVKLIRQLSKALNCDMAEAVRIACQNELARRVEAVPARARVEALRAQLGLSASRGPGHDDRELGPFVVGTRDVLFVTGSAIAACMMQDEPCAAYFEALDTPNQKYTAPHAKHHAELVLMERAGLPPSRAIYGVESFLTLTKIKSMAVGEDVREAVLQIRHELRETQLNSVPSDSELMDEACCRRAFRLAPVLIGPAGRLGTFSYGLGC